MWAGLVIRDTHIILFSPYYSIPVFLTFPPIILNIVSYHSQVMMYYWYLTIIQQHYTLASM